MADMAVLLTKVKHRLMIGELDVGKDALLTDLIEDAKAYVTGLAYRTEYIDAFDPVVVWKATADYNQLGLEGEKSHAEGGVSISLDAFPAHLKQLLNAYRIGKVGGA